MTKVLHIIDHPGLGGAQRLVNTILEHRQDDMVLALRSKPPHLLQTPEEQCLNLPNLISFHTLRKILRLPSLIRSNQIQVVHCHLTVSWMIGVWLSRVIHKNEGIKYLFHAHNTEKINRPEFRLLSRWVSRVGRIIVVSKYIQSQFMALGIPEDRLFLLYNFVDLEKFRSTEPEKIPLDPDWVGDNALVGFAGRLTYNKGLFHLVEAIHLLRAEPVKFLIAGIGSYQQKLAGLIKKYGIADRVKVFGYIHELPAFFHTIDVFTSPSLMESFGLVHLEAQASGRAVVAFDIEAIRETIGAENALLAQKGSSTELAKCILKAVQDGDLRKLLEMQGLENVKKFSMTEHLAKLDGLYKTILEKE